MTTLISASEAVSLLSKQALRQQATLRRSDAHKAGGPIASQHLAEAALAILTEILSAQSIIAGYAAIRSEIDPLPLLTRLFEAGHQICLPVVSQPNAPLSFRSWTPGGTLTRGQFGTLVPPENADEVTPDILLMPLLSFDHRLYRLGYGGGYYDRTLAALRQRGPVPAFGLAYAAQQMDALPIDPWDIPLDAVLTETGLRRPD